MNFSLNQQQILRVVVILIFLGCLWYLASNGQLDLGSIVAEPTEPPPTEEPGIAGTEGDFDFYVLALSWSPEYCSSNNDPQQCSIGRRLGFVLHGLWPQYNRGYPSDCSNAQLPTAVREQYVRYLPQPQSDQSRMVETRNLLGLGASRLSGIIETHQGCGDHSDRVPRA